MDDGRNINDYANNAALTAALDDPDDPRCQTNVAFSRPTTRRRMLIGQLECGGVLRILIVMEFSHTMSITLHLPR